ncbi:hypothetical protein Tco_0603200 [Tanacetum coccineum]
MLQAFPVSLPGAASRWLRNQPSEPITTWEKWHNETSSRTRSTETSDGLAAIQAQLNNLGREIKESSIAVTSSCQDGCEIAREPHYTKDSKVCKKEGLEAYPALQRQILETKSNRSQLQKLICSGDTLYSDVLHYAAIGTQHGSISSEIVPFPRRLLNFDRND